MFEKLGPGPSLVCPRELLGAACHAYAELNHIWLAEQEWVGRMGKPEDWAEGFVPCL